MKLTPVPLDGVPPIAVHAKEIGGIPPVTATVHVRAVPTVPVAGHVIAKPLRPPLILMVADMVAVFALASVTVTETVYDPAVAYIVVRLEPVPDAGDPPVAVQANV